MTCSTASRCHISRERNSGRVIRPLNQVLLSLCAGTGDFRGATGFLFSMIDINYVNITTGADYYGAEAKTGPYTSVSNEVSYSFG